MQIFRQRLPPIFCRFCFNSYRNCCNNQTRKKSLTLDTCTKELKEMQYAVRGPVLAKAKQHVLELKKGMEKPFKEVILTNVGDAQAMGQRSITFTRQVASLCLYPQLLDHSHYPTDVQERAVSLLKNQNGCSMGSCSNPRGIGLIRQHIADYITNRDKVRETSNPEDIFMGDGASTLIKVVLGLTKKTFQGKPAGCLVPVPMYPLYSATTTANGLYQINYYLDESHNWELDMENMKAAIEEAREHCAPKMLVLINPGNPTGNVLTRKNIEDAIKFVYKEKLILLADEVYQENLYKDNKFHSVRKVMFEMGAPYNETELFSFMSASKGFSGECGFRSGYVEIINIEEDVKEIIKKVVDTQRSPNTVGQVVMDTIIHPPTENDPSYEKYINEREEIKNNLSLKAEKIVDLLNAVKGIKCNSLNGAMYAFPQVTIPDSFIEEAEQNNLEPNQEYCMRLLNDKGITVIPGSGFGQQEGTYHFRTTILPPIEKLEFMVKQLKEFNEEFYRKYG